MQGGDDFRGWGIAEYLQAQLIDSVRELTYVFVSANSKKKQKRPEPFPRPKSKTPKKNPAANKFAAMARIAYKGGRKNK